MKQHHARGGVICDAGLVHQRVKLWIAVIPIICFETKKLHEREGMGKCCGNRGCLN